MSKFTTIRTFRDELDRAGDRMPEEVFRELNSSAQKLRLRAIDEITKRVALSRKYVDDRLLFFPATKDRPESRILAASRGVLLTRFKYQVLRAPNKTKKGTKPAGITGRIVPSRIYTEPKFFRLTLKGSGAPGIAVRTGKGRNAIKVLHGPSVSQVFRMTLPDLSAEWSAQLEQKFLFIVDRIYGAS